jgi:hypothetical protein
VTPTNVLYPFLRQAAPQWSGKLVGHGESTFSQAGCLVVALTQAARILSSRPASFSPLELNDAGKALGGFTGSNAIIPSLALCAGLAAPKGLRVELTHGRKAMTDALLAALESGWLALLRVDRDPDPDVERWHWVLALMERAGEVVCADPATGRRCIIDPVSLLGTSDWPSGLRSYEVTAVVPVGPAAAQGPRAA